MSIHKLANASVILDRIKIAYKLDSDAELSRFLDVSTGTVSTWRKRNALKLYDVLEYLSDQARGDLNLNWLCYGEGPIFRRLPKEKNYNTLTEFDVQAVLSNIKEAYKYDDQELESHLGISTETMGEWIENNSPDWDIIFEKCSDLGPAYILGRTVYPNVLKSPGEVYSEKSIIKKISKRIKTLDITPSEKIELLEMLLDIYEDKGNTN